MPPAPGVWRPTPPANAPFFGQWLATVRPLMLTSPSQFRPAGPARPDLRHVRGRIRGGEGARLEGRLARTPAQTETALFISTSPIGPLQAALRDLVTRREMDISDRARLFAAVNMSVADAIIASWDSKVHFGFWRPITAIQLADEDGNPATAADADWEPLSRPRPTPTTPAASTR